MACIRECVGDGVEDELGRMLMPGLVGVEPVADTVLAELRIKLPEGNLGVFVGDVVALAELLHLLMHELAACFLPPIASARVGVTGAAICALNGEDDAFVAKGHRDHLGHTSDDFLRREVRIPSDSALKRTAERAESEVVAPARAARRTKPCIGN